MVTIIRPNFDIRKRLGIDVRSGHRCLTIAAPQTRSLALCTSENDNETTSLVLTAKSRESMRDK